MIRAITYGATIETALRPSSWIESQSQQAMLSSPFDVLVLDAGLRPSLVTVRSLGQRNRTIAALDTRSDVPAFASRWCRKAFVCPASYGTDVYLEHLEDLLE